MLQAAVRAVHDHGQLDNPASSLPRDGLGCSVGAVDLGENHRKLVFLHQLCDFHNLFGAGLAAGFLLDGGQQRQTVGRGEILEPIMEGNQAGDGVVKLYEFFCQALAGGQQSGNTSTVFHILLGMVRVQLGQARLEILHHLCRPLRVHPVVGVPVAVVVAVVAVVVVGQALQQRDSLGTVHDLRVGGFQGVFQKFLQPRAVDRNQIGAFDFLHIPHGQGVVMQTTDAARVQPLHGDVVHILGEGAGKQIDGIGCCYDGQFMFLRRSGGFSAGQDPQKYCGCKGKGQQRHKNSTDFSTHMVLLTCRILGSISHSVGFVKRRGPLGVFTLIRHASRATFPREGEAKANSNSPSIPLAFPPCLGYDNGEHTSQSQGRFFICGMDLSKPPPVRPRSA